MTRALTGISVLLQERSVAFYWQGKWVKPGENIQQQHFAFRCEADDVLLYAAQYLKKRNMVGYNFLNNGEDKPMVFTWMPAISIYFNNPDNHSLEFIAILAGKPKPELGVLTYEEWNKLDSSYHTTIHSLHTCFP